MKRRNSFAFALIALVALSPFVKAETVHPFGDGHFCTSKGYLAFDYYQIETNGNVVKKMHSLKIVRFAPKHRIYLAGKVSLPAEFNIWWMDCNTDTIEITGRIWKGRLDESFTKCDVKIESPTTDIGSAECVDNLVLRRDRIEIPRLEVTNWSESDPLPSLLKRLLTPTARTSFVVISLRNLLQVGESTGKRAPKLLNSIKKEQF